MESEEELESAIRGINPLAASPELYEYTISLGLPKTLGSVLSHENSDIFLAVASLIKDLTDDDAEDDDASNGVLGDLVDILVEEGAIEMLVENLARLGNQEQEDSEGLFLTLSAIENIVEFEVLYALKVDPQWFIDRISFQEEEPDSVMLFASEILAIHLQKQYPLLRLQRQKKRRRLSRKRPIWRSFSKLSQGTRRRTPLRRMKNTCITYLTVLVQCSLVIGLRLDGLSTN